MRGNLGDFSKKDVWEVYQDTERWVCVVAIVEHGSAVHEALGADQEPCAVAVDAELAEDDGPRREENKSKKPEEVCSVRLFE